MRKKSLNAKKINHKKILLKLSNKKIFKIYKKFEKKFATLKLSNKTIAAAISGGPDSNALAFLMKCISLKKNFNVEFYHVNHCLRSTSSREAKILKKKLKNFDIKIKILKWNGKKPQKNVQSEARKIRYKLMFEEMKKKKIENIFLAHTKNDLIENFFLRLTRGSGSEGLVSFANLSTYTRGFTVIRPLLNINKSELTYISKKVFNFYLNDVSNLNETFKRVRFRRMIQDVKNEGLNLKKLNQTIENLSTTNKAIKFYVNQNILHNSNLKTNKKHVILSKLFFEKPYEIIFRSFSEILRIIGDNYYPPRGKKLSYAINLIQNKSFRKTTLGRCVIEKSRDSVLIYKEYKKKT